MRQDFDVIGIGRRVPSARDNDLVGVRQLRVVRNLAHDSETSDCPRRTTPVARVNVSPGSNKTTAVDPK